MKAVLFLYVTCALVSPLRAQNIGIGTSFPSARLQVHHRATLVNPSLQLYDSATVNSGGPVLQFFGGSGNRFNIKGSLSGGTNPATSFLDYFYNNKHLAALTGDGRFVLGSTFADGKLHINHRSAFSDPHINLFDSSSFASGNIVFGNSGGSRSWNISTSIDNSDRSNQYFIIGTDGPSILLMYADGRVGINKSPSFALDVSGDIGLTGALRFDGSAGAAGQVPVSGGSGTSWTTPSWNPSLGFNAQLISHPLEPVTDTKLRYAAEQFDDGADYISGVFEYAVPSDGVYQFNAQVSFFTADPGFYEIILDTDLLRGNGILARSFVTATRVDASRISISVNCLGRFTTGTRVMAYAFHTAAIAQTPSGGEASFFSGFKLY
jgi:hypothetical protein